MKRKEILTTENTERTEVDAVGSGRSVANTEDLPDGFQMTDLGPLPKEWRVVRLGEVAGMRQGQVLPTSSFTQYGYPVYGANGRIGWFSAYTHAEEEVLVTCRGATCGTINISPPKSFITNNAMIVTPIRNDQLRKDYLAFALQVADLVSCITGSGQPQITKGKLSLIQIPLPPLPEQRAIAHVLRTVQRAKEATEGVIAALKELKKSLMQHLFTYGPVPVTERERVPLQETEIGPLPAHWRVVRLGEVVEKTKQIDPRKKPEWFFKYVDVSSVDNELLRITSYQNFAGKEAPSRARKQIDAGDVLFATVRPYLKRIAIVPPELDGHICSTAFCVLRAKNEIDACYLFFAVAHEPFVQRVAEHQRGSSYPAVTDQDVLREVIPLPPLDEQREIARMLQAVDAKIAAEQARRAALEELFKTLLHALMSGRIRVPNIVGGQRSRDSAPNADPLPESED